MTRLQCSAVHCEFNDDNHCCLPGIKIGGGDKAHSSRETCCDSFRERSNQASNRSATFNRPDDKLNVSCSACKCKYNHAGACCADNVKIGNAAAYRHQDTECHTFCKNKSCC